MEERSFSGILHNVRYLGALVHESRVLRFAARVELEVLFDAIALDPVWRAERLHGESMLLDGDGVLIAAYGSRKADYCSCSFYIWAADAARAESAKQVLLAKAGPTRITEPMSSSTGTS